MANTVNLGSLNFPKLMRHVGHRTTHGRDIVFMRDTRFEKDINMSVGDSYLPVGSSDIDPSYNPIVSGELALLISFKLIVVKG